MRLVGRLPTQPVVSGLLFAALLVAGYALIELIAGVAVQGAAPVDVPLLTENRLGFAVAALAGGYALAAGFLINAGNAALFEEIAPLLGRGKPDRRLDVSLGASRLWGTAGVLAGVLFAYEARVESAREWPFDASTLVRFALLLTVPLVSWLGGALVERVVDRLLD
jgi:hypothetical protein